MHNSYLLEQQSNKEIQKIVDNMFVIKIMNKAKEEVENFSNTLQDYNKNLIKNHMYGSFSSFLPSFITLFIFSILITVLNLSKTITLDFIGVYPQIISIVRRSSWSYKSAYKLTCPYGKILSIRD